MAVKRTPTPEQQKVIDMTDRTVLLSAAAGSGKTATLTDRLIKMITREENPLDVTRMLVVTFTRAAAEELRVRISEALAEAAEARPDDNRLARQLLLLPTARIRTIDAFCNDLVKGHTEELGISPLYRIADEAENDLLGISLFDEVIEDAYNGTLFSGELAIGTVVEIAESVKDTGALARELYEAYRDKLHGTPRGVALLEEHAEALKREATLPFFQTRTGRVLAAHHKEESDSQLALLKAAADALLAKEGKDDPILRTLFPKFTYLCDFLDQMKEACEHSYEALRALIGRYELPKTAACPRGHEYTEEQAFFKRLLSDTDKELKKRFSALTYTEGDLAAAMTDAADISHSLYLLFSEFERRFRAEKKRRALCDYDDITGYAYSLLLDGEGNPTPLALEMRAGFDAICIDEYQDVNETQHRIFEAISTERNRFMVGDIKQSIYAFRGALPDIFGKLRATLPSPEENAESAVLFLTRNFRSEAPVINFANGVFDFLFPIIGEAIGYVAEDRLHTEKTQSLPPPTFYLMEKGEEDEDIPKKTEDELITELVCSLLASGKRADGAPLRPSDIAVLSREYPYALVEEMKRAGIPLKTKDKTDFFSRKEILLALSLCHAVNNPHRDIPLSGLLRSPLYGFTMDELLTLRSAKRGGSLFSALSAYAQAQGPASRAARAVADLSRYRAMAENAPAHRLIRTMFSELGVYAVTDQQGRQNLRTFYELARSYEATVFRGLYRFLDRVAEIRRHGKGLPARDMGEEEAVTVTTIHGSKGLEYPVCILAHTGKTLRKNKNAPFLFSEELGVSFPIPTADGRALLRTPLSEAQEVLKKRSEMEEAVRVLYVALTRPKESLYLFCSGGNKRTETLLHEAKCLRLAPSVSALCRAPSYAAWMLAALDGAPSLFRSVRLSPPYLLEDFPKAPPAPTPTEEKKENAPEKEAVATAVARYRDRFAFRYPHEAQTRLPAKLSVSVLSPSVLDELAERSPFSSPAPFSLLPTETEAPEEETPFTPSIPAFLSDKEEDAAAKAGTATHLFLQFCDFDRILTADGCQNDIISAELDRLCDRGFLPQKDKERVRKEELAAFLRSDLAEELRTARELYREFRFHAMLPAEDFSREKAGGFEGLSVFAQGVVDLILVRADGTLLLVDYKTDRLKGKTDAASAAELLFARHGTQLSVYARAAEKIFGTAPEVAIYSLPLARLLKKPE